MKTQFEVGRWYRFFWLFGNRYVYGKIERINNECIITSSGVWMDRKPLYRQTDGYELDEIKEVEEITDLSEIQQYLPDGHIDKQNVEEWIPQVDDWVVVTEQFGSNDAFKGMIGQITDLDLDTAVKYEVDNSWCLEIRKALPHEIPDDFVLPEKWCIKTTDVNKPYEVYKVYKWRGKTYFSENGYIHNNYEKWWDKAPMFGYTEITLEQFKKYVLKEENNEDIIVPFDSLWKQMSKKSPTTSSEIHIPKLEKRKADIVLQFNTNYPKIDIRITPKVQTVNKLTIKSINIKI